METIKKSELLARLGGFDRVHTNGNNQFDIEFQHGYVLQSYGALVAAKVYGVGDRRWYFTEYHDYSRTTAKHVTQYCGYDAATRRKMLANGEAVAIID